MGSLTPLATIAAFSQAIRAELARYWITSLEEFVGVARSGNRQFGSGLAALAQALGLPEIDIAALVREAQASLPPDSTFESAAELAVGTGAIFEGMPTPSAADFAPPLIELPPEQNLAESLPPCRSQGRRSTCVAFTLAAMAQRAQRRQRRAFTAVHLLGQQGSRWHRRRYRHAAGHSDRGAPGAWRLPGADLAVPG